MKVLKTGGWAHLVEYGTYIYGDVHQTEQGTVILRVITNPGNVRSEIDEKPWVTITKVGGEFVDGRGDGTMQTLIADHAVVHFEWRYNAATDNMDMVALDS